MIDTAATMNTDATKAERAISRKETALGRRRRHQVGSLIKRGKRRKVWIARWREDMLMPDGTLSPVRRAEVLGPVAELSKSDAQNLLDARVRPINQGRHV